MIDLSEADLADGLHLALGIIFVILPVALGVHNGRYWGSGAGFVFGIIKEFWFDLAYEDEKTSGGIKGGWIDLAGYVCGIVMGNLLLLI